MQAKYNEVIKGNDLAKILNISDRHVRNLASDNILVKSEKGGKYLFLENVHRYINYIIEKYDTPKDLKEEKLKEDIKKVKIEREIKEIKKQELKNQLHSSKIIEQVMGTMLLNLKGKLLSIPNKIAPILAGVEDVADIQNIIQEELLDCLNELVDYNSDLFKNNNIDIDDVEEEEENKKEQKKKKGVDK